MLLTRHRITAVAALALAAGLALLGYGLTTDSTARTTGGVCLTSCALVLTALLAVRSWITDTTQERARLESEKERYQAAKFALAAERDRMRRDAINAERRAARVLAAEREALHDQFEEERNQLICRTFETAFRLAHTGIAESQAAHRVIPFPSQPHPAEGETTRGRGVTRP